MMRNTNLICSVLVVLAGVAHAQFIGGDGDGFHASAISNVGLDGGAPPPWIAAGFTGGDGDGFHASAISNVGLNGGAPPPWISTSFTGGDGDGFYALGISNVGLDGGAPPPWVATGFTGGPGDGHDARTSVEYQFTFSWMSAATFPAWQASLFTGAEIAGGLAGALADFDGDGISNALEYALGLDPRTPSTGGLPFAAINDLTPYGFAPGGPNYLSLVVHRSPYAVDAVFSIEVSTTLTSWTPNEVVLLLNAPDLLIARDHDPVIAHLRRLMRLKVTLP